MNDEFIGKVKSNILNGGFPTELEVAHVFKKRDWTVLHNTYFIDKDENKSREIDLIADFLFTNETDGKYTEYIYSLIVEIKQEKKKPWVIFTSDITGFEKMLLPLVAVEKSYTNCKWELLRDSITKHSIFNQKRIGRSFTEGFSSGKDKIFNSLCNVTKALTYSKEKSREDKSDDRIIKLIEPLIVVKGDLLEAFIDDDGDLQVMPKDYIQFSFNYLSEYYKKKSIGHIVNIVKFEYLENLISEREKVHKKIFQDCIL